MTLNKSQIPESCLASVSGSTFVNADCFDVFPFIEDKSIDAIICDEDMYSFFNDDGETYLGSGESIEDCKRQIDEL